MRHRSSRAIGAPEGVVYRDTLARLSVDVPDTIQSRDWMKDYRERWKGRLEQVELWMISYSIEVE